jgi:hypothetical protein
MKMIEVTSTSTGYSERITRAAFNKRFGKAEGKEILAGYLSGEIVAVEIDVTLTDDERTKLVAAVKQHALANYEKRGWDILIECHSDAEITGWLGNATTPEQAIKNVKRNSGIGTADSYRRDIQAEGC